ncbi:TonB-dependent receptor [Mucilaginibacter sp.]|jgi:TonB-linked SusC/RagA family outer membrane protein|uniref:SusC/RagA family TonB-linked outer membrane protein n=1 Tax=Mucilaginibacter sp. TaxID=1882438 RepID=UPI00260417CA|nr:TonB-dependent receptor [Mucilaginibacter sp.]MDB5126639.1 SusC/RagA family TonB-linked outer membrane protein [Mucilaginibacter sp.]
MDNKNYKTNYEKKFMKPFYERIKSFWLPKTALSKVAGTLYCIIILCAIFSTNTYAQTKITITGTIADTTGNKIVGANITATNKKNVSTATDVNGKFVIDAEPGTIFRVTYVGYKETTFTVLADTRTYSIQIKEVKNEFADVVITAYGRKQRKEAVVGSVTTITPSDLKIPASNLTNALAGQVAGVIAYQPSGQPGLDNSSFFIRGVTTFGYKKDPLILIDNVELSTSDLARLQVDDIASFSILKDASATALYGARGANGVILVTTKEGKVGKPVINVRVENSISQSAKSIELADPITYMRLFNEATITRDPLSKLPFTPNDILNREATIANAPGSNQYVYPAVDWLKTLFKDRTNTQRADLSVSGGGGVARYYVSGSYNIDHGILREDIKNNNNNNVNFRNYQLRSNVNINITKSTELVVRLVGTFNEYNGPLTSDASFSTDLYNIAMHTSPVLFPAYYPADAANQNTQHILFGNAPAPGSVSSNAVAYVNPYAALLRGHKNFSQSRLSAQLELNQNLDFLTSGLNFHGLFHTNRYSYFESSMGYKPFYYNIGSYDKTSNKYTLSWLNSTPGAATEYLIYNRDPYAVQANTYLFFQGVVDYTKRLGDHNISSSLIATQQQTLYGGANDLFSSLPYRNLTVAGRATYSFKSRYFLEFNFGYNGTERFSANHRFGFFPTIGGSWIVSDEKFWGDKLYQVISRMKLRASYGTVGNDQIGSQRFFYLSDVNLNGGNPAYFGTDNGYGRNGVTVNNYANSDITWETSKQLNIGMELTLFKNLNIVAEVYKYHRTNILQTRSSIPTTMGLESNVSANFGEAESKGIDLQMDYKTSFGKSGWIQGRGNLTIAASKYSKYEEPEYPEAYRYQTGQSINRNYGYIAERLFVDDNEALNSPSQIFSTNGVAPKGGDIKYRDLNGDGKIDGADLTFIGYPTVPQIVYGYGLSSGYKGFDLSAFFQGQAQVSFFIDPSRTSPFIQSPDGAYASGNTQLLKAFADDHWSEDNQNLYAQYPRLGVTGNQIENNRQNSTWWMRDGSFLRLKSVEIGYTIPARLTQKWKMTKCRIYFNGLNLYTWSPFKLWDPEVGGNGFAYPIQKVFNIGLNINL